MGRQANAPVSERLLSSDNRAGTAGPAVRDDSLGPGRETHRVRTGCAVAAIVVLAAVVAGCSGNASSQSDSGSAGTVTQRPDAAGIDFALRLSILQSDEVAKVGAQPVGDPVRFQPAENVHYSLVPPCGLSAATNDKINGEWQGRWSSTDGPGLRVRQIVVHYAAGMPAAMAVHEIAGKLASCETYLSDGITYDQVPPVRVPRLFNTSGSVDFCTAPRGMNLTDCTVVIANGQFASTLTVRASSGRSMRATLRELVPLLADTLAHVSPSTSPTSASLSLVPVTQRWTLTEAREHLAAMAEMVASYQCGLPIDQALNTQGLATASRLQDATYFANDCADRAKDTADNIAAGRWPAAALAPMRTLVNALHTQQQFLARLADQHTLAAFTAQYRKATKVFDRTRRALTAATAALR